MEKSKEVSEEATEQKNKTISEMELEIQVWEICVQSVISCGLMISYRSICTR